jgi:hypothetical protein
MSSHYQLTSCLQVQTCLLPHTPTPDPTKAKRIRRSAGNSFFSLCLSFLTFGSIAKASSIILQHMKSQTRTTWISSETSHPQSVFKYNPMYQTFYPQLPIVYMNDSSGDDSGSTQHQSCSKVIEHAPYAVSSFAWAIRLEMTTGPQLGGTLSPIFPPSAVLQ